MSVKQNMLYNAIGSLFYLGCQWLITILAVRLGSVETGGVLTNCNAVTNVLFAIATFGIRTYQVSDIENRYSASNYVSVRMFTGLASLCVSVVYAMSMMGSASFESRLCVMLYMVFRLSEAISDVMQAIVQKAHRMDYIFKGMVMRGVAILVSFVLAMKLTSSLPLAIVLMALGAFSVIVFYELPSAKKHAVITLTADKEKSLSMLKMCWPLMLVTLFVNIVVSVPRSMLGAIMGERALGFYGMLATPAVIVQAGSTFLFAPLIAGFAIAYTGMDRKRYVAQLKKLLAALCAFTLIVLLGAHYFGEWVLVLIFKEVVRPYANLFVPALLTAALLAINQLLSDILTISRKMKKVMWIQLISAAISVALSPLLIESQGINGVNITMMAALCVGILLKLWAIAKDVQTHFTA